MQPFGPDFVREHGEELKRFLFKAQARGYGSGTAPLLERDGAQTITFEEGNWHYTDTWYGGEPYSGVTIIAYKSRACWTMVYWGGVLPGYGKEPIYDCLKAAITAPSLKMRENLPVRGPENFVAKNGYVYQHTCTCKGSVNIKRFYGFELISKPGFGVCYRMDYHGGFVDLR